MRIRQACLKSFQINIYKKIKHLNSGHSPSKKKEWGGRISVRFQGKPFNITVIQVYAPTSNAEETEAEQFYEDLQDL